jgi:hypothetical protein
MKLGEMMNDNPWKDLITPANSGDINARRVNTEMPWGFYWALDLNRRCLLVFQHSASSSPHSRLPKFKGIEVNLSEKVSDEECILTFRLLDSAHRDIFQRLCEDIIASTSNADSEKIAVEISIARTWRWHHLLRGGGELLLTDEEQKGLIGELLVIERYLLPSIPPIDAVSAWLGPLGAPKDFEIGRYAIEAKARRGGAKPYVSISSEHQLDGSDKAGLFLHVVTLDRASANSTASFSVADVAARIRRTLDVSDHLAVDRYESLLAAAGFRWEDDYSGSLWVDGQNRIYKVTGQFPRIVAGGLVSGVHEVSYSISMIDCEPFLIPEGDLLAILSGA